VSTDLNLQSEEKIGNYRFVRMLLQGQNSEVLEVVQDGTGKRFAMKQLLDYKGRDASERRAFEFEAKLGQQFRHPNLVRVYEYVKHKTRPYFVMDFFDPTHMRLVLNKPDLKERVMPRLHKIITQAASGLAYMHEHGWVHRDVKPENVIVNKTNEVRLIDYALAKKIPAGLGKIFAGKPPREGTHSYMSPEQILCLPPAPTADMYSLGITIYEFACGRQPFRANSANELLNKHIKDQPTAPTAYNKEITREFSDLVMHMLKKKPKDRPQNMHEFISKFSRIRIFTGDPDPRSEG
jgi:eukaryotic-like serine/threonine-protein kinase